MKHGQYLSCQLCGKTMYAMPYEIDHKKYCSKECLGIANGNRLRGKPAPHAGSPAINLICKVCQRSFSIYPSQLQRERGYCCGRLCADKWHSQQIRGPKSPVWKGGISPERQAFYAMPEWKQVSHYIRKRDNYHCQRCGINTPSFHIHHIISFQNTSLRMRPENLILLCKECHLFVHSNKNHKQEFLQPQLVLSAASQG